MASMSLVPQRETRWWSANPRASLVIRRSLVDPDAVHVEMRPRPAGAASDEAVVPLRGGIEIARSPQVLFYHGLIEFHPETRGVRHGNIALVEKRLRAQNQLLPPGNEVHRMALHGDECVHGGGRVGGGDGGQRGPRSAES